MVATFGLIFLTYPIKIFGYGHVQVSSILTIIFVIFGFIHFYKDLRLTYRVKPFLYLFLFSLWTVPVNVFYYIKYKNVAGSYKFILDSGTYLIYFFFAFFVFLLFKKRFELTVRTWMVVSLLTIIPYFIYLIFYSFDGRPLLFFINKNQFSHWAYYLLMLSSLIFISKRDYNWLEHIVSLALIFSISASFISISRMSMLTTIIAGVVLFFVRARLVLIAILVSIFLLLLHYKISPITIDKDLDRIETKYAGNGIHDSFLMRGYWKIVKYPKYLLFGAGENVMKLRFEDHLEIHSLLGNILFAYGMVGFLFFVLSYYHFLFTGDFRYEIFLFIPLLLLSLYHNIIRVPYVWLFPVLYYYGSSYYKKNST